ncbi:MAG: hypothetical protein E7272_07480 [Pseudobutyrivibrio ruminis]|uniref:Uncharacterized protein n=1 Tax=Pseudobutyrivibrio ruminis TaxID=46206 RepID=A0A927U9M4_9FIRM|nr:hypothetical protein [Pseudobutyrivibrio ruminis]
MGDLKYITGMFSEKADDFNNISWWYGGEQEEVLFIYNAVVKDISKLNCYERIKEYFDTNALQTEAKIEVLINKDGIVREICFIRCQLTCENGPARWNDIVIGNKQLNIDKAIGHSLLSHKEFLRVKELGLNSYKALKEYFNWEKEGLSEWKKLPKCN